MYLTPVGTICSMPADGNFPRDLLEFEARFSTEAACREYLFRLAARGLLLARAVAGEGLAEIRVLLQCSNCDYQSSVTAGTIFQDTRQP